MGPTPLVCVCVCAYACVCVCVYMCVLSGPLGPLSGSLKEYVTHQ